MSQHRHRRGARGPARLCRPGRPRPGGSLWEWWRGCARPGA